MVTLSPSVSVISLVTRNGSFSTCFGRPDHHFVGGRQHGVGQVGRLRCAPAVRLTSPLTKMSRAGDAEIQIGRRIDARLGHVDQAQVFAVEVDVAVGQAFAPLDFSRARERARAGLGGGAELEIVGHDARFHLERAQREIELVEVELGAGELDDAAGDRRAERALEAQVGVEVAAGAIDLRARTA